MCTHTTHLYNINVFIICFSNIIRIYVAFLLGNPFMDNIGVTERGMSDFGASRKEEGEYTYNIDL